ncbi:GatB/YqeY domain-containing protein [Rubrobacter indicoceani]|uniref:GatB/YqeY domain-containing protein n=1 Tax=Rubrobacter indicoceani TaxID=2051957 RepID=UPI000E5B4005|nr:GatB/YqeY domain-containing protein [Rubrobacter indicoceani]
MTTIAERIQEDTKTAMKARDRERLGTLRMLNAALKNASIDSSSGSLSEDEEQTILKKQLKQRNESAEAYRKAGREEQAASEEAEAAVIGEYLPEPLSGEELEGIVDRAISETGAEGMRDMGRVMARATELAGGRADGRELSGLVRARLQ